MSEATLLPEIVTSIPGPASRALAERLARVESANVTRLAPLPPIFWERASGSNVWDVDGNRFLDLGGAFGVANVGHAHPEVVRAVALQAESLLHGMGDVHPPRAKVALLEALAARFPGAGRARAVLASSGSDAVEIALKTALLATGRAGVIAFRGGYHGLGMGALDLTWRQDFKAPFAERLPGLTRFAEYGREEDVARVARDHGAPVGAVIVEPVQGRGGECVPPAGFLRALRDLCDRAGWLLIVDEIYTGFGRTGSWFACEHEAVVPDLLCVGKGLSSGMPLAACIGREDVMAAWPASTGEALHTQTFLGHPPSCAAGLASIAILEREGLPERAALVGQRTLDWLRERSAPLTAVREARGLGLMIGIACENGERAAKACADALARGVILLPSGEDGHVLSVTPPLTIAEDALRRGLSIVLDCLR